MARGGWVGVDFGGASYCDWWNVSLTAAVFEGHGGVID